ncbi:hypothetical protein BH23ACT6_BH23ACT6_19640 [soil metagenome]
MWHNSIKVEHYYASSSRLCYAILQGMSGWKRVDPASTDGVSNVGSLLAVAHAEQRTVSAYLVDDQIERVMVA